MKRLTLNTLSLWYFKGVKEIHIDFRGGNSEVYGDNATGKSTLYDAFLWLLFGKDSRFQGDFGIKTKVDGKEVSKVDHTVEAEITHGEEVFTLKKTFKEVWTKKRGQARKTFTGHETKHFINGVAKPANQYKKFIKDICQEDLFRLLTSPLHFNENLHHTKRREMLLDVCGTVSDAEIIEDICQLPDFDGLKEIWEKTPDLEDHRDKIRQERTQINERIEQIPIRIDQITQDMPTQGPVDVQARIKEITAANNKLTTWREEIAELKQGGTAGALKKEQADLDAEVMGAKRKWQNTQHEFMDACSEAKRLIKIEKGKADDSYATAFRLGRNYQELVGSLTRENENLKAQWWKVDEHQLKFEENGLCPTCSQDVPVGNEFRENHIAQYNSQKAEIQKSGQANTKEIASLTAQIEEQDKILDIAQEAIDLAKKGIKEQDDKIEALMKQEYIVDPELKKKQDEIMVKIMAGDDDDAQPRIEAIQADIVTTTEKVQIWQKEIQVHELQIEYKDKITVLTKEEETLAARFEQTERELDMIEGFIREKVSRLDGLINSKFDLVRFKLFEEHITGGITATCVCTIDGVDYKDLNSAGRIQAGIDIIKTLSKHHEFSPVIFVDNRESVVRIPEIEAQVISLYVDPAEENLVVKTV